MPHVLTEPLGGSALAQLVASGQSLPAWYAPRPNTAEEWRARVADTRDSASGGWLDALMPALSPSGAAAERLRASAAGQGVVVTTGQQPGLFGGPIYTWSKALSALALADRLQESTGVPVAPVFWAATDDSDFAEASWTMVARRGGVDELRMPGETTGASMAHVPLGDVTSLLAQLERGAGSAAYRLPLDAAQRAYGPGRTVGGAYVALLRELLEPLGISVLDAAHPAVRAAAAPMLRSALRNAHVVGEAVAERDRALLDAGHTPQVAGVAGLSLVFATARGQRQRVPFADAPAAADTLPDEALSPNVLLRPVVERRIFPTVAYVAGPAELAYFAQTSAVAAALGAPVPLAVPRWSCTIREPDVDDILARFALTADDLQDPHAAETRIARLALPSDVSSAIARIRAAVDEGIAALPQHGGRLVPPAVIEGGARSISHRVARMERRFVASTKRRMTDALEQIGTARGSLFPNGTRQERALNFLPLLARYGRPLLDEMRREAGRHASAIVNGTAAAQVESSARAHAPDGS